MNAEEKYLEQLKDRADFYKNITNNIPKISVLWLKRKILNISEADEIRALRLQKLNKINDGLD